MTEDSGRQSPAPLRHSSGTMRPIRPAHSHTSFGEMEITSWFGQHPTGGKSYSTWHHAPIQAPHSLPLRASLSHLGIRTNEARGGAFHLLSRTTSAMVLSLDRHHLVASNIYIPDVRPTACHLRTRSRILSVRVVRPRYRYLTYPTGDSLSTQASATPYNAVLAW